MAGPAPPQSRSTAHPGHIPPTTTGPMAANSATPATPGSGWSTPIAGVPKDPPKSTTKGRAKSKRLQSALELHPRGRTNAPSTIHLNTMQQIALVVWFEEGKTEDNN